MRGYWHERYPVAIKVKVHYPAAGMIPADTWEDGIKGLNPGHAMWRAQQNWPGATIEYLGTESDSRAQ